MIDDLLFEISGDREPRYLTAFERVNSKYDVASVLSPVEQYSEKFYGKGSFHLHIRANVQ